LALFFMFYINLRQKNKGANTENFVSVFKNK